MNRIFACMLHTENNDRHIQSCHLMTARSIHMSMQEHKAQQLCTVEAENIRDICRWPTGILTGVHGIYHMGSTICGTCCV